MPKKVTITVDGEKNNSIQVNTEVKRGEVWLREEETTVLGGEKKEFNVHGHQRLLISDFATVEEPVYDRGQGAAILPSQQKGMEKDKNQKPVDPTNVKADPAKEAVPERGRTPPVLPPVSTGTGETGPTIRQATGETAGPKGPYPNPAQPSSSDQMKSSGEVKKEGNA